MTVHVKARLLLVSAAVLFSTGGAAIKWTTLTAWQVAGLRSLIAAIALLILLPDARRHWSRRNWLVGVVYAMTLVLFVTANKLTTAANAIFLQAAAPLYILLGSAVAAARAHQARRRAVHAGGGRRHGCVLRRRWRPGCERAEPVRR